MKEYDFLIVGAGIFGCTFAHQATQAGKRCLVIDKRSHIGGNTYCKTVNGINVHYYGAHIFHTNDRDIWEYVNSLVEFNRYTNSPLAMSKGVLYNMPFNMNTFNRMWGVKTPAEARAIIEEQKRKYGVSEPRNLEEQALSLVGKDIYETLIKEYTEKQWGKKTTELPAFIIKRVPLRFNYDNNYFNDRYQGIPIGGYNKLTEAMLKGSEVKLNTDFFSDRPYFESLAKQIVYSGKIDQYFNYSLGELEYRSLRFEHKELETDNYQGNAVVNYIDKEIPYTRVIEHKHFEFGTQPSTVITYEYPDNFGKNAEPYYPINDQLNTKLFKKYEEMTRNCPEVIFGGRLAEYRYYDMHQVLASAMTLSKKVLVKE